MGLEGKRERGKEGKRLERGRSIDRFIDRSIDRFILT